MALARAGSSMPASSTTIRSSPTFWISGSVTPNSSMRFRSTVSARSRSRFGIGGDLLGLVELQGEVHPALEVEAQLERHPLLGAVVHHARLRSALPHGDVAGDEVEDAQGDEAPG